MVKYFMKQFKFDDKLLFLRGFTLLPLTEAKQ